MKYGGEAWATLTSGCSGGFEPRDPVERARERRRAEAVALLEANFKRRFSVVVSDVAPRGPASEPVSVMVAIRTKSHGIVTAELAVPAARWDAALFLKYLQEQDERLFA